MMKYVPLDEAQAMIDSSEANVRALQDAVRTLQDELLAQEVKSSAAEEIAEAKAVARVAEAVAKVTGDLQAALARCAGCEQDVKEAEATIEQQRKALQEAVVAAATSERLRLAAEKKQPKPAPVIVPAMSTVGYRVEGMRRDGNGDLQSFKLTPDRTH